MSRPLLVDADAQIGHQPGHSNQFTPCLGKLDPLRSELIAKLPLDLLGYLLCLSQRGAPGLQGLGRGFLALDAALLLLRDRRLSLLGHLPGTIDFLEHALFLPGVPLFSLAQVLMAAGGIAMSELVAWLEGIDLSRTRRLQALEVSVVA